MPSNDDSQDQGEVRSINLSELRPGPLLRESLTEDQTQRARAVYEALQPFVSPTFEQFELNFLRDADPESEIQIWENIAVAFQRYEQQHGTLSEADETTLFKSLLLISMCGSKPTETPQAYWDQLQAIYGGKA